MIPVWTLIALWDDSSQMFAGEKWKIHFYGILWPWFFFLIYLCLFLEIAERFWSKVMHVDYLLKKRVWGW
jgi:hypothetical protein